MLQPHDLEGNIISAVKEFARSINSGSKVVADMSSLIQVTSQLPLSNLDHWERLIRSEFSKILENSTQPKWKIWSKPSQLLSWLDIINWDGYKREKTLRTLSGAAPNSFFFSLAIRRLNDWVPQVREAAREKLPEIADKTDPKYVVEALCINLSHWNSWGRIQASDKQVLLKIISNPKVTWAIKSKLISSASGPMTSLLSQVGRTPTLDKYLIEIAENALQPSVRAKAYRSQFEEKMVWMEGRKWEWTDIRYCKGRSKAVTAERKLKVTISFLELLKKSSCDRSSIVRRVAAEFLICNIEKLGAESLPFAKLFASDTASPVFERGRFALKYLEKMSHDNAT